MGYYKKALEYEPKISALVKKVAKELGLETRGFNSRMKSKRAYLEKLEKNCALYKSKYEITDILRYTYIASPDTLIEKMIKAVSIYENMGYKTIEIKNYWLMNFVPYNGINTVISSPTGLKFEVQYHTLESYEIKEQIHELYEEWRKLPQGSKKAKELNRKMFAVYEGASIPKNIRKVNIL